MFPPNPGVRAPGEPKVEPKGDCVVPKIPPVAVLLGVGVPNAPRAGWVVPKPVPKPVDVVPGLRLGKPCELFREKVGGAAKDCCWGLADREALAMARMSC